MDDCRVGSSTLEFAGTTRRDAGLVSRTLVKVDYFGRLMSYREVVLCTFPIDTVDGTWIENVSRGERQSHEIVRRIVK